MREILFRGKTESGKWVEGSLILAKNYCCILQDEKKVHEMDYPYLDGYIGTIDGQATPVNPETIGQYTGLTDKNGKKIFEGDILKQKTTTEFAKVNSFKWERYGIVRFGYFDWNEGEAGYASEGWYIEPLKSVSIKPKNYLVGDIQSGLNQFDIHDIFYPMEVIDNIHDNPKLLKEGADNG